MQIQINTDHNIKAGEALAAELCGVVEHALRRFSDRITRLEVHLGDENGDKKSGPDDMSCMMEARLKGRKPIVVTHRAGSIDEAVAGAADKMTGMIESTLGRLHDRKGSGTARDSSGFGQETNTES